MRGAVIERERLRRLWSIEDLARITGVSARTLNGISPQGKTRMKLRTLDKVLRAFEDHPATDLADEVLAGGDR